MDFDTPLTQAYKTKAVLKVLPSLPEKHLLLGCENTSQVNHWYGEKVFYTDLNCILTYYFMGKVAPKKVNTEYQEILEAESDKWISFYDLLHCSWEFIEIEAIRIGLDLHKVGATSPGEAIQLIIKNQSAHDFLQIKANHLEYSPQKAHRRFKECIDILNPSMSHDERQKIMANSKYKQKGKEQFPELQSFYTFCLLIVKKYADKSKRLNKKFNSYIQEWIHSVKLAKKLSHPSRRQKGFTICNGEEHRHS